jgi:riboflavin synthase
MFTGIVQGIATVESVHDRPGLRHVVLRFPQGFDDGLTLGASVACDGVCLTVTEWHTDHAGFDLMQQTLNLTRLGELKVGDRLNIERAARSNAEIGGHPLSGHIDFMAALEEVRHPENNHVMRIGVPRSWMPYLFAKGYIALNGASLTIASVDRERCCFEVWLIPETLRMTTFADKVVGSLIHIEIDRTTQVIVETVQRLVDEHLARLGQSV